MNINCSRTSSSQHNLTQTNNINQDVFLDQPCIVGYMSVDVSRNYHSDISQLKFVTNIPKGRLSWNLNHNIERAVKRTTDNSDEKIDLLLKFMLDQKNRFNLPKDTFITYRYTLIKVMCSAFHMYEPICVRACLYNNNIYLDEMKSDLEIQRRQSRSEQEKTFCAWGYKFEQYLSSDHPAQGPNIDKPVIENEEFSLFFRSQLGNHKLFYGAQVDGLLATSPIPPPPETDVQETINYLRQHQYIELKTNKEILNSRQERNLRRYKMLTCWCQCYLANYKGLLMGFRNDEGIVQRLKWYDTAEIVEYCRGEWDPQTTLNFLNYFLTFVKNTFQMHHYPASAGPITLDFHIGTNRTISVTQCNEYDLLPDWYINAS